MRIIQIDSLIRLIDDLIVKCQIIGDFLAKHDLEKVASKEQLAKIRTFIKWNESLGGDDDSED